MPKHTPASFDSPPSPQPEAHHHKSSPQPVPPQDFMWQQSSLHHPFMRFLSEVPTSCLTMYFHCFFLPSPPRSDRQFCLACAGPTDKNPLLGLLLSLHTRPRRTLGTKIVSPTVVPRLGLLFAAETPPPLLSVPSYLTPPLFRAL